VGLNCRLFPSNATQFAEDAVCRGASIEGIFMGIWRNTFLQGDFTTTGEIFSAQGGGKILPVAPRIGLISPQKYSANA